jgi:hypothetical protein
MTTNILLPTEKEARARRVELLDIPAEMTDPSYVDALSEMVTRALNHRAGVEHVTVTDAREIVLTCISAGYFIPAGWRAG